MDTVQTAPVGAVWSGSTMFASMLMTFSDAVILLAFKGLNNVFCVYTEEMAEDDTVILIKPRPSAFTYVQGRPVLITHSWGAAFTVTKKSYNINRL